MSRVLDLIKSVAGNGTNADATTTNTPALTDDSKKIANTEWVRDAMENIASTAGFAVSANVNGYIKMPSFLGGIIIQWGKQPAVQSGGAVNITFPIPFPANVFNVEATICNTNGNTTAMSAGVGAETLTGCSLFHNGTNAATAIMWLAIGK